jgi:hypothetical protein
MRRFAKFTYPVLARCCSRVLLELEVLICAGLISFAAYWPATGQLNAVPSTHIENDRSARELGQRAVHNHITQTVRDHLNLHGLSRPPGAARQRGPGD